MNDVDRDWELKCFGFDSPAGLERVPTPAGLSCIQCEKVIVDGDPGFWILDATEGGVCHKPWHRGCLVRAVIG